MGESDEITPKKLWIAVLLAVLGGNASGLLNILTPTVRNDPMTGSEGRRIELEVHRIDAIQQLMQYRMSVREEQDRELLDMLKQHLKGHP